MNKQLGMCTKKRSKNYCSVFGCKSYYLSDDSIGFHRLPKANKTKILWKNKYGIQELVDRHRIWTTTLRLSKEALRKKNVQVCSKHFTNNDYFPPGKKEARKRLKPNSVPSQNLPKSSVILKSPKKRLPRNKKETLTIKQCQHNVQSGDIELNIITPSLTEPPCLPIAIIENQVRLVDDQVDEEITMTNIFKELKDTKEVGLQVTSGDIFIPFISLIDTTKKLISMTGICSFELLDKIVQLYNEHFPDKRQHRLNLKERILMIFLKLKQGLSFVIIAILFKYVTAESCRTIYTSMIPMLAHILQPLIYWPTVKEIASNIPFCFESFKNTRVVLDCTEIPVQRPKCLSCRIKCYSNYKSTFTIKFLIGVSPAGLITFISKPYGGRASDKAIFEQSNIIEMMHKPDAVMVDKGFLIDDICKEKAITIIRPPFLKNMKQFSKEDALLTKEIAKARVHIERINQRLRTYKIFQHTFPWSHNYLLADIMTIISGICNLSPPIFSSDKFNSV